MMFLLTLRRFAKMHTPPVEFVHLYRDVPQPVASSREMINFIGMKDKNLSLLERLGIRSAEANGPKWKRFLRDRMQKRDQPSDDQKTKS